ncbi:ABC transporter substrate-binding protein [Naasia lichenicola]|nr:extracellular solute-binding protein [Naasia lichenicola]
MHYRGLTWDHPRGRSALEAAARKSATDDFSIDWDVHTLEGFESAPIEELAERYDLIVLDHPHLGDALAGGSLRPMSELFDADELAAWETDGVGPSFSSYRMDEELWALPLDAATQVSARRADLIAEAPRTWDEVRELSRTAPVALSLAGPHAFLSLCSIIVSLGGEPAASDTGRFVDAEIGERAFDLMRTLADRAPAGADQLNPIAMLDLMTAGDSIAYCPLIYGYVNYSSPALPRRVSFGQAPVAVSGGRIGSTIGGTGIAVSRRTGVAPELLAHIRWLMSPSTQSYFIPTHEGQPSARSAWNNELVDAASGRFYSGTLDTIEQSWVRPRFPGYIPFQSEGSGVIRAAIRSGSTAAELFDALTDLQRAAIAAASARKALS